MDLFALPDWSIWGLIAVILLVGRNADHRPMWPWALPWRHGLMGLIGLAGAGGCPWWFRPLSGPRWVWAIWLGLSRWNTQRHKRPDINDYDPRDSLPPSDRGGWTGKD